MNMNGAFARRLGPLPGRQPTFPRHDTATERGRPKGPPPVPTLTDRVECSVKKARERLIRRSRRVKSNPAEAVHHHVHRDETETIIDATAHRDDPFELPVSLMIASPSVVCAPAPNVDRSRETLVDHVLLYMARHFGYLGRVEGSNEKQAILDALEDAPVLANRFEAVTSNAWEWSSAMARCGKIAVIPAHYHHMVECFSDQLPVDTDHAEDIDRLHAQRSALRMDDGDADALRGRRELGSMSYYRDSRVSLRETNGRERGRSSVTEILCVATYAMSKLASSCNDEIEAERHVMALMALITWGKKGTVVASCFRDAFLNAQYWAFRAGNMDIVRKMHYYFSDKKMRLDKVKAKADTAKIQPVDPLWGFEREYRTAGHHDTLDNVSLIIRCTTTTTAHTGSSSDEDSERPTSIEGVKGLVMRTGSTRVAPWEASIRTEFSLDVKGERNHHNLLHKIPLDTGILSFIIGLAESGDRYGILSKLVLDHGFLAHPCEESHRLPTVSIDDVAALFKTGTAAAAISPRKPVFEPSAEVLADIAIAVSIIRNAIRVHANSMASIITKQAWSRAIYGNRHGWDIANALIRSLALSIVEGHVDVARRLVETSRKVYPFNAPLGMFRSRFKKMRLDVAAHELDLRALAYVARQSDTDNARIVANWLESYA